MIGDLGFFVYCDFNVILFLYVFEIYVKLWIGGERDFLFVGVGLFFLFCFFGLFIFLNVFVLFFFLGVVVVLVLEIEGGMGM